MKTNQERIAVIGLGYVGLPVALAFARVQADTIGFDVNEARVRELAQHVDRNGETTEEEFRQSNLRVSSREEDLAECSCFIVAVPTPVDINRTPDLRAVKAASATVGRVIRKGAVVVFESTVYPGVTEEVCGPVISEVSGLKQSVDFKLGYSPERINPGDREHTLESIVKVVSGEDAETLERVASLYSLVVRAGVHRASSIRVAEAAKVIENTQRDLNIALMNELSIIFDRIGIRTKDVLEAASTKWNFLRFSPGLVGGHCIGVDPYYLTAKAEQVGLHPQVILAGRRINDNMGTHIAQRLVKLMAAGGISVHGARVGVLGLTFKENVSDLRNSRVPDIIHELRQFNVNVMLHDPLASGHELEEEFGFQLSDWKEFRDLDALILAVSHTQYLSLPRNELFAPLNGRGIFVDVKSVVDPSSLPAGICYWSL